jgi:hypothetical protein
MQVISHGSHAIGEFRGVGNERVVVACIPAGAPAVVEDHIVIPEIFEAIIHDQLTGLQEEGFRDLAAKGVPVVP